MKFLAGKELSIDCTLEITEGIFKLNDQEANALVS